MYVSDPHSVLPPLHHRGINPAMKHLVHQSAGDGSTYPMLSSVFLPPLGHILYLLRLLQGLRLFSEVNALNPGIRGLG